MNIKKIDDGEKKKFQTKVAHRVRDKKNRNCQKWDRSEYNNNNNNNT